MWERACVGAGVLAKAVYQSVNLLTDTPYSRASPLPQFDPIPHLDWWCVLRLFARPWV